jgi:hypothetical protein
VSTLLSDKSENDPGIGVPAGREETRRTGPSPPGHALDFHPLPSVEDQFQTVHPVPGLSARPAHWWLEENPRRLSLGKLSSRLRLLALLGYVGKTIRLLSNEWFGVAMLFKILSTEPTVTRIFQDRNGS